MRSAGTCLACLFLLLWPAVQVLPLPASVLAWIAPERARELAGFAAEGVRVTPTASIYPLATLAKLCVLAAALGAYLFGRQAGARTVRSLALGAVLWGLAETVFALRQYSLSQAGLIGDIEPRGTFGNRNLLAACLIACYGPALGLAAASSGIWRALASLASFLLAASSLLTASRAAFGTLTAATLLLTLRARDRRIAAPALLGILTAAFVTAPSLADRLQPSALARERDGRLAIWSDSLGAAGRYWLTGCGAGAFSFAFRRSSPYLSRYTIDHAHSDYLEILVEWGVPAGLAVMAILFGGVVRSWRCAGGDLPRGCLIGATTLLLHALVDFPLQVPALTVLLAVLLGLAQARSDRTDPRRAGAAAFVAAAGLLGALLVPLRLASWNAGAQFRAGRLALASGDRAAAEARYRRGLAANPYAAPLWLELALLAEADGDAATALRRARLALALEPHTRRILWPAANLYLRQGDPAQARALLAALAAGDFEVQIAARPLLGPP